MLKSIHIKIEILYMNVSRRGAVHDLQKWCKSCIEVSRNVQESRRSLPNRAQDRSRILEMVQLLSRPSQESLRAVQQPSKSRPRSPKSQLREAKSRAEASQVVPREPKTGRKAAQ